VLHRRRENASAVWRGIVIAVIGGTGLGADAKEFAAYVPYSSLCAGFHFHECEQRAGHHGVVREHVCAGAVGEI
jgi:hypothetical protein